MSASIRKFCGQAALIAAIIAGGLIMGALTPAYSDGAQGRCCGPSGQIPFDGREVVTSQGWRKAQR